MALVTKLDDILDPWVDRGPPDPADEAIRAAIRAAYRLGHEDGRHARIPQDEETFAERLKRQQEESSGQES